MSFCLGDNYVKIYNTITYPITKGTLLDWKVHSKTKIKHLKNKINAMTNLYQNFVD